MYHAEARSLSRSTARSWRRWEYALIVILSVGFAYVIIWGGLPDDTKPMEIETAYPPAGYTCPDGYEGPEVVTDAVVRCYLHPVPR